jgi:hypothetical protein
LPKAQKKQIQGEKGVVYNRLTDKGPQKLKDELTVKDQRLSDYLYPRAINIPGQLNQLGLGDMGHLERGILNVAPEAL